ncbi:DNA repair protein RecN [Bifidobacterium actinocoloniiforme DSM 22766]|uniref:DNA repair protein RecN n=1 Tax=Bifidobacterium actinocoloniiforme DSM 22766 TaxID=1437605 RepID=A0A086Z0N8_9BIFI|nr:DNA repair protein RecN [Bifidobacterium actinocoloniiforme]AKV55297.1 DNA recombination protein RecN [Bifidobacterium actinocoloniiforme DSM 22766]KFI40088.1 DNA repair protein RecN [Bifidobacterium actinocoloniiforme DSM 22766]
MLDELEVRDLGPIRHARLAPAAGMTAITGETGAGKSMLLNAIGLISGALAQNARVTPGRETAWAQGIFDLGPGSPALGFAEEAGLEPEEGLLYLARSVPAQGRSRSLANGRTVPRSLLTDLSERLVTIHGQSDQMRMASPARQRDFLDAYAGDQPQLDAYRAAWERAQTLTKKLDKLQEQQAGVIQQADYLRQSIERIDSVDPRPGEDADLKEQRDRIEHGAQIAQGVTGALSALDASQLDVDVEAPSVASLVEQAIQSLQSTGVNDLFEDSLARLRSISADLSDLVFNLTRQLDSEGGAGDLDKINARIHDLEELKGRWGPSIEDVIAWRDKARFDLEDMDASPEQMQALREERQAALQAAAEAGRNLSAKRSAAGRTLGSKVGKELGALAMGGAALDVRVRPRSDGGMDAHGMDEVSFLFTPFPGSQQLPMGSSASGGELSRLMLAMELVAADAKNVQGGKETAQDATSGARMTFIFDEVDAGVGGKAAVELGKRLARLATSSQVIVVTHLAQVASWADRQFVVAKGQGDSGVQTQVRQVDGGDREQEIARMLAGSESRTSIQHARELLAASRL